jgi:hypothetical protein
MAAAEDVKEKDQANQPMQTQPTQPQAEQPSQGQPQAEQPSQGQPKAEQPSQGAQPYPQAQTDQPMKGKEVTGTIKSWDSAKGTLTLEDGTTLKFPTGSRTDTLSTGAKIRASYEEMGGEKIITDVRVLQ